MNTKKCATCKQEKDIRDFSKNGYDRSGKPRLRGSCKECEKPRYRKYYLSGGKERIRKYRNTDKGRAMLRNTKKRRKQRNAGMAVYYAIQKGKLPPVSERRCQDCGEQAEHYHHPSYERKDRLNVIPLCEPCHIKRHQPEAII